MKRIRAERPSDIFYISAVLATDSLVFGSISGFRCDTENTRDRVVQKVALKEGEGGGKTKSPPVLQHFVTILTGKKWNSSCGGLGSAFLQD